MRTAAALLVVGGFFLVGCHVAHDVAVTSFKVIDAPANYIRRHIDDSQQTQRTTTTTTTASSDAVTPGRPVDVSRPSPTPKRHTTTSTSSTAQATPRPSRTSSPSPTTQQQTSHGSSGGQQTAQYPTAKPVPGKPGFVYSPYDPNGGYVDVTGYASGSKAKDPYSQKIFIVP